MLCLVACSPGRPSPGLRVSRSDDVPLCLCMAPRAIPGSNLRRGAQMSERADRTCVEVKRASGRMVVVGVKEIGRHG